MLNSKEQGPKWILHNWCKRPDGTLIPFRGTHLERQQAIESMQSYDNSEIVEELCDVEG